MPTELAPPRPSSGPSGVRTVSFDESPLHSLVSSTRKWVRLAGIGRMMVWLGVAVCTAIAIDLTTNLEASKRAAEGVGILLGVAVLAICYLWRRPRVVTAGTATRQVESAHPEIGQMLRTARDASLSTPAVSPVLKSELFRRAGIQLAGLDLKKLLPRAPARKWLTAGVLTLAGFVLLLSTNPDAPTAFTRLLAPFSGITFTQVKNVTPDSTFDRNRLPRAEALVTGRLAPVVTIHVINPEGGELTYQMNPMGGGRYEVTLPASESSFDFRIEGGDSKPALGTMECVDPAEFVSSSAEVTLPEYTGQAQVMQETADIDAVEGTRATLHFKMSAPMAKASLKLPGGRQIPLTVVGSELSTTLDVEIGGDAAELTGTDARGHEIEPTQFTYKGFADTLPVIEWIEPTKDIDATAVAELPLRFRVRDDFGIASYGVIIQAQGESKDIMTKTVEARDLRDLAEMTAAALETFPLTIRDNVRLYAWAKDHKPRGAALAVSQLRSVDIKPFKRKWQMLTGGEAEGIPIPEEDLVNVEKLIKAQREILSDAFAIIQGPKSPDETITALGQRETKLQQDGAGLHTRIEEEGNWPGDDVSLLAAAVSQMGESAAAWGATEPLPGFDRGDAALSTLLELRKNLMTLLLKSKSKSKSLEAKPEEVPNQLTDLAKEAERLAKEEFDVARQLNSAPDTNRLNAIRRQQEVANSDTGELHARLMDHPESTPLILSHMADAEDLVREATGSTRSADAVAAAPPQLAAAADELEAVAKHLRALDEANMDQTLAEMAEEAKKAAEAAKPEEKGDKPAEEAKEQAGEKPGEKPADKPGAGEKPGEKPGAGEGESKSEQAGKGKGEGKGEGEGAGKSEQAGEGKAQGEGQGKGEGQGEGQSGSKSEETSQGKSEGKSDQPGDVDSKSEQAGNDKGKGKSPGGKNRGINGNEPGQGVSGGEDDLASSDPDAGNTSGTGEKSGVKSSAPPGNGPSANPGNQEPKDAAKARKDALDRAARQAATHDDILKFFADREAEAGKDSRFDALRKQTGSSELEKKLTDAAEGKTDGKETAEDLKTLAAALEQERELRRQSRLETLAISREQAAQLKKEAEARRDAAREAAREVAKSKEGGFSFDIPKKVLEEAKKAQGKNGRGGEGGEGGTGNGPGRTTGKATQDLARNIDALKDTELSRIARELEKAAPDISNVKPLADAERRLAELIAEISGLARGNNSGSNVPPAYRRAVEDYYRALSDDFGDEAPPPP